MILMGVGTGFGLAGMPVEEGIWNRVPEKRSRMARRLK
jgi:hypothetical protein